MKKQYFADKRDYLKFSILRHLLGQGISTTVCWMMTTGDDSGQGGHRGYLKAPKKWRKFDPEVFDYLKAQVDGGSPDIHSMERQGPITRCRFYWERLQSDLVSRKQYLEGCLQMAAGTDLVFFDPDIGPKPNRIKLKDLDKYVLWDEICATYHAGHSVMVFNFLLGGTSQKDNLVATRGQSLRNRLPTADVTVLRSHDLAFYFAAHNTRSGALERATKEILEGWRDEIYLW